MKEACKILSLINLIDFSIAIGVFVPLMIIPYFFIALFFPIAIIALFFPIAMYIFGIVVSNKTLTILKSGKTPSITYAALNFVMGSVTSIITGVFLILLNSGYEEKEKKPEQQ